MSISRVLCSVLCWAQAR